MDAEMILRILSIVFVTIVTIFATRTINSRLFKNHEIGRRTIERFPLTATAYYRFFYRLTPFMGCLAGLLGMIGVKSNSQFLLGIALGAMGQTILIYLIVDPITTLFEYFFYRFYKYRSVRFHGDGKDVRDNSLLLSEPQRRVDKWIVSVSFWIPRKHREGIVGDILEDCYELRRLGKSERRIWLYVLLQFVTALVLLWPAYIKYTLSRIWHTK